MGYRSFRAAIHIGLFVALIAAISGCSTSQKLARIDIPQTRFESPEALGKSAHQLIVGGSVQNSTIVEFPQGAIATSEFDNRRVDVQGMSTNPYDVAFALASGAYGFTDSIDIGLEKDSRNTWLKVKSQLYGVPESRAGAGNFSASVVVRLSAFNKGASYSYSGCVFCSVYEDGNFRSYNRIYDVALLGGYRLSREALFYSGGFYQEIAHDAHAVRNTYSNNLLSSHSELSWRGKTTSSGISLGMQLTPDPGKRKYIALEISRARTTTEAKSVYANYGGIRLVAGW